MKRLSIGVAVLAAATVAGPAVAHDNPSGFRTSQAAMADPVMAGVSVEPIITVGDTLGNGYRYEAIPDGTSARQHHRPDRRQVPRLRRQRGQRLAG